jgi:hypothetical protein
VITLLLLVLIAVMTNLWPVQADTVEGPYLLVTPSVFVAKALNESFVINVDVSNVQNLRAFEFKLGYNTTLLDVLGVAQGHFFPPPPKASIEKLEINETVGFVWIRVSLCGSEPPVSGSGTLVRIAFGVYFNSTSDEEVCCALSLYDTLLYGDSMATIVHISMDGLYFFRRVQDDPPSDGRLLDLYTQKGGVTQGASGGVFTVGEMVELGVNLTYNGAPVENKLVSFEVLGPKNESVLGRVGKTDDYGFVMVEFRIPYISESIGTWTVVATADVSSESVWDFLTFEVRYVVPVGGYSTTIESFTISRSLTPYSIVVVIITGAFVMVRRKRASNRESCVDFES